MQIQSLSRDDMIIGGLAVILAIGLIAFPWFDVSVGPFSATFSATSTPDGWLGILAFLSSVALVGDLAVERFSPQTTLPALPGGRLQTRFVLAALAAAFVALKFVFHIHFDLFGWGFYVDVILAAALVYVAFQTRKGVSVASQMPKSMPRRGSGGGPSDPPA